MIEKFLSLSVDMWMDGAWGSNEGQVFISARRELYDITDSQYAEVLSLIDKLEKGVGYLGRAVDPSASRDVVEAEATEYCSIKGCDQYVQSLVKVFMARRGSPPENAPPRSVAVVALQAQPEPDDEEDDGIHRIDHDLHIPLDNRLWFDFEQVLILNLQGFNNAATSKRTCASLQRSNFGALCSQALKNIADFLSTEIVKRGHFDDWNGLFEAQSEQAITFASELDEKVHEVAFEALNHSSRFQAANRQDPNHKYLSFAALGVIAGVGSFISEMQRSNESTQFASDIDGQLAQAVAPAIDEMLERIYQAAASFYDAFATRNGLMSYHDMNGRQDRATALMKNVAKITDPMVAARALAKIFDEFPFQDMEFVKLVAASAAPDQFKRELVNRLQPYLIEYSADEDDEPEVEAKQASTMRKVVASYRSMPDAKVWVTPHIPEAKFRALNGQFGFADRVQYENALVYQDDTMFGKGDDGILITETHFCFRSSFESPNIIPLKDIRDVTMTGMLNKTLGVSWRGGNAKVTVTSDNSGAKMIYEILQQYLNSR